MHTCTHLFVHVFSNDVVVILDFCRVIQCRKFEKIISKRNVRLKKVIGLNYCANLCYFVSDESLQ